MFDLSGRRALVTGASGGIGGAIARVFHARGASLALTDMRAEELAALADELGPDAHALPCDLTDADGPKELVKQCEADLGGVDIVINNAGLTRDGLAMRLKEEDWRVVLEVNLTAGFKLCQAVLRPMMKQRWGRIIGIASIVGVTGNPGQTNYAASKAGMIGYSKALAGEVASRGITVNCIAPGFIATPMTDVLDDNQRQALLASIPMGSLGSPDDVAAAAAFLASPEAAYITGQTLHVNGGMAMI